MTLSYFITFACNKFFLLLSLGSCLLFTVKALKDTGRDPREGVLDLSNHLLVVNVVF